MSSTGSIFVISSQVVSGLVGLKAAMPALRALDFEAITLPSILLAAHPSAFRETTRPIGEAIAPDQMLAIADWLLEAGALDNCQAVLTGYLPSAAHVEAASQIIAKLKARNPSLIYCCDPICGDHGALYLPVEVAQALRDTLLPLADMATPNLFELSYLSGVAISETADASTNAKLYEAAQKLNVAHLIVTSAPAPEGRIASVSIETDMWVCETLRAPLAPNGMGDFFAALYLGLSLKKEPKALGICAATLAQIAAANRDIATLPHGPVQLAAPALTDKVAF